jgi:lipopolysaccharide/colanic/teichoic acid biosynthesis glycosyltransferase
MRVLPLFPTQTGAVLFCDFLLVAGIYTGSLDLLLGPGAPAYMLESHGWLRILIAALSVIGGFYFNELYSTLRVTSRVALALKLCNVFGLSLVFQTLLAYINSDFTLPRRAVLLASLAGFPLVILWRWVYSGFLWKWFGQQTVLVVGSGPLAQDLVQSIYDKPERGVRLAGYVGDPLLDPAFGAACLGPFSQLAGIVSEYRPDRIVVACDDRRGERMPIEQLLELRHSGLIIEAGPKFYEALRTRICASEFRPEEYIFDQTLVHRPGSLALQSIYINILALGGIVLLSPLLMVLAVLVGFSTKGPVLDPVVCLGYRGIPFVFYRFRITRVVPGTSRLVITRVGHWLRSTRLDTLPALFNLLRGEMALVGPRPARPEIAGELAKRIPFYEQRYALKPGVTGWSQITVDAHSSLDALAALEYDLSYLKHLSLSLDAYILLHRLRNFFSFAS